MAMRATPGEDLANMYGEFASVLQASVDLGCVFLDEWMPNTLFDGEEWGISPVLLYRSILEKLDGATVLIEQSCTEALALVLRTALEGTFGLEYMLKDRRVERSLSYLYFAWNDYSKDRKELDGIDEEPLSAAYEPVVQELKRLKTAKIRRPNWYTLFPSADRKPPLNAGCLADVLDRRDRYRHLYRPLSKFVHNATPTRYAESMPDGTTLLYGLRFPTNLQELTAVSVDLCTQATDLIVRTYAPDYLHEFRRRVSEGIQQGQNWLRGPQRIMFD